MGTLGPLEIFLIFMAILLIFGAKRIPEIARGMGKGIREFRAATREITEELTVDEQSKPRIKPPQQTTQPQAQAPKVESPAKPAPESE